MADVLSFRPRPPAPPPVPDHVCPTYIIEAYHPLQSTEFEGDHATHFAVTTPGFDIDEYPDLAREVSMDLLQVALDIWRQANRVSPDLRGDVMGVAMLFETASTIRYLNPLDAAKLETQLAAVRHLFKEAVQCASPSSVQPST